MAVLYPGTSVSGYNSNPPPDDGTTVSTNQITWNSTIKAKLGDPLNTFASAVDSNITSAFGKTIDGSSVVSTGTNYPATAADQGRLIKATASGITITTPDSGTVTAPFVFGVNNQSSGTITLAGNATGAQTVDGATTQVIQPGGGCIVKTDGTNWFTFGLTPAQVATSGALHGFDMPVNLGLVASVGSNLLTIAVKTKAGNDPSAGDPVLIPFRDVSANLGDPVWITLTGALSINTNAVGATLGTQNGGVPFRFWVVAFNNGGSVVLALWHSGAGQNGPQISNLNETVLQSSTGMSAAATSSGTFYSPNGVTISNRAFRILGYVEYTAGLTTAGTYASAPNIVQLFGPGVKKPGDEVQTAFQTRTGNDTTASTSISGSSLSIGFTPSSAANLCLVSATTNCSNGTGGDGAAIQIMRSATPIGVQSPWTNAGATATIGTISVTALDLPGSVGATTYTMGFRAITGGTASFHNNSTSSGSTLLVRELMA